MSSVVKVLHGERQEQHSVAGEVEAFTQNWAKSVEPHFSFSLLHSSSVFAFLSSVCSGSPKAFLYFLITNSWSTARCFSKSESLCISNCSLSREPDRVPNKR